MAMENIKRTAAMHADYRRFILHCGWSLKGLLLMLNSRLKSEKMWICYKCRVILTVFRSLFELCKLLQQDFVQLMLSAWLYVKQLVVTVKSRRAEMPVLEGRGMFKWPRCVTQRDQADSQDLEHSVSIRIGSRNDSHIGYMSCAH